MKIQEFIAMNHNNQCVLLRRPLVKEFVPAFDYTVISESIVFLRFNRS